MNATVTTDQCFSEANPYFFNRLLLFSCQRNKEVCVGLKNTLQNETKLQSVHGSLPEYKIANICQV